MNFSLVQPLIVEGAQQITALPYRYTVPIPGVCYQHEKSVQVKAYVNTTKL